MRYLYLDNFRGFENTFIPIKDVNFLVGENSTGKSSVLALINLLGSFSFWLNQEFNDENVELGAFKDIVSAHSDNRSTFRVGVLECDVDSAFPSANQNTFLLTFEDQKGQPIVKRYNYINNDKQVEVIFSKQQIRYKIEDIASCDPLGKTLYTSFLGWTTGTEQTSTGYKILALDNVPFSNRGALAAVRFLINQLDLNSNHAQDKEFSFQISLPSFADRLSWIAPIRSKPQRTYDGYKQSFDPAGEHIPYLIKDMLSGEKKGGEFQRYIAKFGQESNLFENVYVKNYDKQHSASPFELGISLNGTELRICDVGYGVSQSLPIVVDIFARSASYWYAIQQPEVHLHPKAQAALGDLICQMAEEEKKKFFIETHSDYLIDRFRLRYGAAELDNLECQTLFFERHKTGNRVTPIDILPNGDYSNDQPAGFRDFFIKEQMALLGL